MPVELENKQKMSSEQFQAHINQVNKIAQNNTQKEVLSGLDLPVFSTLTSLDIHNQKEVCAQLIKNAPNMFMGVQLEVFLQAMNLYLTSLNKHGNE